MSQIAESENPDQNSSLWSKLTAPLIAVGQAISYDPREQADAVVNEIRRKVEQLENRVDELEK